MTIMSRRDLVRRGGKLVTTFAMITDSSSVLGLQTDPTAVEWLDRWMASKLPTGTLHLFRFKDPIYVLTKAITWKPNDDQKGAYQEVTAPIGFVTDFASIPRAFWSLLRPDGDYTYPAIIHDYLYWFQDSDRITSDNILLFGMTDFAIPKLTSTAIYDAVRVAGGSAWNENARLKASGERRILKELPNDPRITWDEWKKKPGVFY